MDEKLAHGICLLLIIAIIVLMINYHKNCSKTSENFSYPLCETSGGYPNYYGSLPPLLPVAAQLGVNYITTSNSYINNPYANMYSSLVSCNEGFSLPSNDDQVFLLSATRGTSTPTYIAGNVPWNINL
jgi:hypothetical protein